MCPTAESLTYNVLFVASLSSYSCGRGLHVLRIQRQTARIATPMTNERWILDVGAWRDHTEILYMAQAIRHPWERSHVIFGQGLEMRFRREAFLSVVNIVQVGDNVKRTCRLLSFFLSFFLHSQLQSLERPWSVTQGKRVERTRIPFSSTIFDRPLHELSTEVYSGSQV